MLPGLVRQRLVGLAALGSAGLLGGAFFFQYVMGLAPCPLCIWQRWPHGATIALALLALLIPVTAPLMVPLAALSLLIGAGIAAYHVGVEQGLWDSVACGAPDITGLSPAELLAQLQTAPTVACDEVAWSWLGISMAGWNGLASLGLFGLLLIAMTARPRPA